MLSSSNVWPDSSFYMGRGSENQQRHIKTPMNCWKKNNKPSSEKPFFKCVAFHNQEANMFYILHEVVNEFGKYETAAKNLIGYHLW